MATNEALTEIDAKIVELTKAANSRNTGAALEAWTAAVRNLAEARALLSHPHVPRGIGPGSSK